MHRRARWLVAAAGVFAVAAFTSTRAADLAANDTKGVTARKSRPAGKIDLPSDRTQLLMFKTLVAEIALQRGDVALAVSYYTDVVEATHDPIAAQRAVQIAMFARQYDAALRCAQIWVEKDPTQLDAQRVLAVLYLRKNEVDKAIATFSSVLAAKNEDIADNYFQIGALLRRELDKTIAVRVMEQLVKLHPESAEAAYSLATLYMWAGEDDKASGQIDLALKLKPDWSEAVSLKARVLHSAGNTKDAVALLKGYLKGHEKDAQARFDLARIYIDSRGYEDARAQYEILAKQQPDNEEVLYALGILSLQFKDTKEAQGHFTQLFELGKRADHAAFYLGEIAEQNKNPDEALTWYDRVQAGEFRLDAALRAANIVLRRDGLPAARDRLHAIQVFSPQERREVILAEGGMLRDARMNSEAYALFTRAVEENKDDTKLLYARALVAERLDKLDVAEADLRAIIAREPDNATVLNALGYTLADRTTRFDEALKLISRALELQANDPAILDSMGWVQYRLGNVDKALEYLKKAIALANDGEIAAHLGEVLWVSGRKDEAVKVWNTARKDFSDNEALIKVMQRYGQ